MHEVFHHATYEDERACFKGNASKFTPTILKSVSVIGMSEQRKKFEIEMTAAVCCHCSISSVDHIGELISRNAQCGSSSDIKLHRTKCSRIIENVISKAIREQLIEDIHDKPFSLICDESTDISCDKHMCALVVFYNDRLECIDTFYLGLCEVPKAAGQNLYDGVVHLLQSAHMSLDNCIGLATDGASNMVGEHNSLFSRVLEVSPNCALIKCVCHSLELCVQKAFEHSPSVLGFLLGELPSWFCRSSLRRAEYRRIFDSLTK